MPYDPSIDIRITDNQGDGVIGLLASNITLYKKEGEGAYNPLIPTTDYIVQDISPTDYAGLFRITPQSEAMSTGYYTVKYNGTDVLGYVDILYIREFPIPIEHGGTGATDPDGARANLGLVPGTDIMAYNMQLNNFLLSSPSAGIVTKDGPDFEVKTFETIIQEANGSTLSTAAWKYHVGSSANNIVAYGNVGQLKLPVVETDTQPSTEPFNVGDMLLWQKLDYTVVKLLVCAYSGSGAKVWHPLYEYNYTES